jgi:hypothetical protein
MTTDPTDFDPAADTGPPPVGAFVSGPPDGPRQVVRWLDQFRDAHELADHADPTKEAYLSLYHYPATDYCAHFVRAGYSPRGYAGPAGCRYLLFDLDRAADRDAALVDARAVVRFLLARYPKIEDGIGTFYSGRKGFHVLLELLPGFAASATVPATCKRLALAIAAKVGVQIDTSCFDHQRLVRLPNSLHPTTALHKRFITLDELFNLSVPAIRELARHPVGFAVPTCGEFIQELEDDWNEAAAALPVRLAPPIAGGHPVVPKYVRDFIGFGDIQDPGRAVTLFRCAAALAQVGTPAPVVVGLLHEPAVKTGLDPREVERQLREGIAHGMRSGDVSA